MIHFTKLSTTRSQSSEINEHKLQECPFISISSAIQPSAAPYEGVRFIYFFRPPLRRQFALSARPPVQPIPAAQRTFSHNQKGSSRKCSRCSGATAALCVREALLGRSEGRANVAISFGKLHLRDVQLMTRQSGLPLICVVVFIDGIGEGPESL